MLCITEQFIGHRVTHDFMFYYVFHHFTSEADWSVISRVGLTTSSIDRSDVGCFPHCRDDAFFHRLVEDNTEWKV